MKRIIMCLILTAVILPAAAAHARDYLKDAYEQTITPAKIVFAYDECVKQGYLENDGPTAEARFRHAIDKVRTSKDPSRPKDVTGEQVAAAEFKAVDMIKAGLAKKPVPLNQAECNAIQKEWPALSEQFGLQ
ncbi:MAG: hypothetical protein AB7H77_00700 [Bdellovibrionales bacterium]